MFYCSYLSDCISMVSVCVGLWIWNVCVWYGVWYCVCGSGVSSLVSACINPCGSLSSTRVVSFVVSSCFTSPLSPSPVVVFFVVPLHRFHLRISTPASSSVFQPSVLRSSFWHLALAWTLDRRRGILSQMPVFALCGGILAVRVQLILIAILTTIVYF